VQHSVSVCLVLPCSSVTLLVTYRVISLSEECRSSLPAITLPHLWGPSSESEWATLTLILLTWRIWWASNNASRWQMGFNWAFKGLIQWCSRKEETADSCQINIDPVVSYSLSGIIWPGGCTWLINTEQLTITVISLWLKVCCGRRGWIYLCIYCNYNYLLLTCTCASEMLSCFLDIIACLCKCWVLSSVSVHSLVTSII
jgi:hypothetical protein